MGKGPWSDGRRAWERLAGWYQERRAGDPLAALADIGTLRRLLDEAELEAVRHARGLGRSWAEIAIKLGVTRQSAWERWRDLDAEPAPTHTADEPSGTASRIRDAVIDRAARSARRHASITVPSVVGRSYTDARQLLAERGLLGVPADGDAPPIAPDDTLVTDQSPEAGAKAQPGAMVKLWTQRGGGSDVREPRRPKPTPLTGRKVLDEPSPEAVG